MEWFGGLGGWIKMVEDNVKKVGKDRWWRYLGVIEGFEIGE